MKYDFQLDTNEDNSLGKIIKQITKGSTVLEFGPATGRMTKYLKEQLQCNVYIVEIDAESAQVAGKYAVDCIVGDIEQYDWLNKWSEIKFDYIVFADVLEHLRDPQTVLDKTRLLLKDEGRTIISVPNVAHNALMINLYNNIFNYTPVGLLDNTHIHLFAYNTLKEFCLYAGYTAVIEDAVYSEVGENEVQAAYNQVNPAVAKALKERIYGNVYQYVFTLVKTSFFKVNSIEIEKRIIPYGKNYNFQLFLDRANGWCEENSITVKFNPDLTSVFRFNLSKYDTIRGIRIDPIDCNAIVQIDEIKLIYADQEKNFRVENLNTNASYNQANLYFFESNDPNIYISDEQINAAEQIEIELKYIDYDTQSNVYAEKLINIIREISQKQHSLVAEMNAVNEELKHRAEELDKRMQKINELERIVSEKDNTIKLSNEELERRAVELDNRMQKINELTESMRQQTIELDDRKKQISELTTSFDLLSSKFEEITASRSIIHLFRKNRH